ncbi:MAG: hypothetical protein NZ874_00845 [Fimbriimonadales bacterium]|nr:hypothetical protein [Fimbriimonadales bacterium]
MKRASIGSGLAALTLLLHGCGGGGGAGGGAGIVITERVAYVRVVDPATGGAVEGAKVYFVTDTRAIPMRRVVATPTANLDEIPIGVARNYKSDARTGDFVLQSVDGELFFRGLWIERPAGYTAVVRHTDPQGLKRVVQMPNSVTTQAACLVASNRAGIVKTVFGASGVVDFGIIEVFPNNPQVPPPPVDDVCP